MNTINNNSPSFNALYMPSKQKLLSKVGKNLAEGAEMARPFLESHAKSYDLYVLPYKFNVQDRGFAIKLTEHIKNPIKKFLNYLDMKRSVSDYVACGGHNGKLTCIVPLVKGYAKTSEGVADSLKRTCMYLDQAFSELKDLMKI